MKQGSHRPQIYKKIVLVFIAVTAIWLLLGALQVAWLGQEYSLQGHAVGAVLAAALTLPVVLMMQRRDGGTLAALGLPLQWQAAKPLAIGATAFLLPSALGFALVLGVGWAAITPLVPPPDILAFLLLLIALVFLSEALPEELVFRGYVYKSLAQEHARIAAVVAQAVLFTLWGAIIWNIVGGGVTIERVIMFASFGFVLGLVRAMTGSLWATIGLHTAFQTLAQLILNQGRGHFAVDGIGVVQFIALGIAPFGLATLVISYFYRRPVSWVKPQIAGDHCNDRDCSP